MCRSGDRSAAAVNLLAKNGYIKVYTVVHGYEGDKSKTSANKGKRIVNGWRLLSLLLVGKPSTSKYFFVICYSGSSLDCQVEL